MFTSINILGQKKQLRIYTQITLGFKTSNEYDYSNSISILKNGLNRLSDKISWLSGSIIEKDDITGVLHSKNSISFTVKDLRMNNFFPDFNQLEIENFPTKYFNEKDLCSRMTIPGTQGEELLSDEPVFLIQFNILNGGILISFIGEHAVLDMIGQSYIIKLLSKLCNPELNLTKFEIENTKLENSQLNLLASNDSLPLNITEKFIIKPINIDPINWTGSWKYILFPSKNLENLKNEISKNIFNENQGRNENENKFISTDDSLCALICQSITKARLKRISNPSNQTFKFSRAIDARNLVNQNSNQVGVCLNMTFHHWNIKEFCDYSLDKIALELRKDLLDEQNLKETLNVFASMLSRSKLNDETKYSMAGTIDPTYDIQISSWSKIDLYNYDFNFGLGKPIIVRRPTFIPCPGLVYFMPKRENGEVVVAVSLRDDDMIEFLKDSQILQYGIPIDY
ncbi:hypothetical protein C6P40_001374 [Pichia californica]|uniref:Trichothecene 3-O-acetyltransferase-like N-terminal domain-containing protein n=1 Tax=Pichia californica TaxID=460514 RepID=A0A9P7BI07_9ASCO|nr:hypothetical protein C6P42_003071 [[Candida] californica]KAG0690784.1 hypothetical protein C6P40_001374 [[Candida] californica]